MAHTHLCCCFKTGNVEWEHLLGSRGNFKRRLDSRGVLNEQSVFCPHTPANGTSPCPCPPTFSSYPLKLMFRHHLHTKYNKHRKVTALSSSSTNVRLLPIKRRGAHKTWSRREFRTLNSHRSLYLLLPLLT